MRARSLLALLPLLPTLAGFGLCVWRFRAGDELGGLAFCLGGVLLMIAAATRVPGPGDR